VTKPFPAAPVAVFAFNRPDTLSTTLRHLEQARGFAERSYYLFCDGPRDGRDHEVQAVEQVKSILSHWAVNCDAECHFSERNRGLRESITSGISTVLERHDRVIVLEDDIVCSRSFLTYMDQALGTYNSVGNVWQISGHFVPGLWGSKTAGFLRMPACWGWGTWRKKWSNYNDTATELHARVKKAGIDRFNIENSYHFYDELARNVEGRLNTWHVRWYASMFLANAVALYPGKSLTRNIGFDARGSNCQGGRMANIYHHQPVWHGLPKLPAVSGQAVESPELLARQIRFHRFQQAVWTQSTFQDRLSSRFARLLKTLHLK
jgi:hypothetical protein